jgi:4-amino-4-deoxy-L-arabinose transferase-like glycosyltransferase
MGRFTSAYRRWAESVPQRERRLLFAAMGLSFLIVIAYVVAHRHATLAGDEPEYLSEANYVTQGKFLWSTLPYGIAHASAWKAPLYPAWAGTIATVLGTNAPRIEAVQALLLAPLSVLLTWLLARRLFSLRTATVAAFVVAVFPLAWEYFGLLYPEALAIPATTLALLLFLERDPTPGRAAVLGAVMGVGLLIRPTSFYLFAGIAAAYILARGWRSGLLHTAISVVVAILVVAPWTIRNAIEVHGFVPISIQDGAIYGTFNSQSANDPVSPYAWRAYLNNPPAVLTRDTPVSDAEVRTKLQDYAFRYIKAHPDSLLKAFYWNGLSRTWDIRHPGHALDEAPFEGRSRGVTLVGLLMYYALLPLALLGLWRFRSRRTLVIPVLLAALAASVVFTTAAGTRYRAPLEPLIVVLACAFVVDVVAKRRSPKQPPAPAAA